MRVHDSQAYRKMDVTRERISCILELREILLSFQTGFGRNVHLENGFTSTIPLYQLAGIGHVAWCFAPKVSVVG